MFPPMTHTSLARADAPQATHTLTLTVNGEVLALPAGQSVAGLLAHLGLPTQKIAVERNLEIVPRSLYGETLLSEGDQIEIVHFIGGG
jgi:sulfur carrier protein